MKEITQDNYYQDSEYLSNTMLGLLKRSSEHLYQYQQGTLVKEKDVYTFGQAYHCAILEPEIFEKTWAKKPPGLRRGTKPYEEFEKENEGKKLLSTPDYDKIMVMKEKLATYQEIWAMLHQGEQEKIITWENDGVMCKGMLDGYHDCRIMDLKTTQDCSFDHWSNTAKHFYDYDRQAAWYINGAMRIIEVPHEFWFVVQEKDPPYIVAMYECSEQFIESGTRKYVQLLKQYRELFVDNKYAPGQAITGQLL